MDYFSRCVSDFVKTAISSLAPNKVACYTLSQYEAEYTRCEIICNEEPHFYLYKVALHFDMVYVPHIPESFPDGASIEFAYSIFRFQGERDAALSAFARHMEVLAPLHEARQELHLNCDRTLIERIATFSREHFGWTAAHIAAALPWPEVFNAASMSTMFNERDEFSGKTPLGVAIDTVNVRLVERLLQFPNLRLDGVDHNGDTVLHCAATPISGKILSLLLDRIGEAVDINALNNSGDSALYRACHHRSSECVEQLLKAGASPLAGATELPLQVAVSLDSMECVTLICMYCPKALHTQQPSDMSSPLHLAGNQQIFNYLCDMGANLDLQNYAGLTVLHQAVRDDDLDRVIYLLSRGVDPDLGDNQGATALHYAVKYGACVHILRALIAFEADPTKLDKNGLSARHMLSADPSGSFNRSEAKDLALYTLHAVGAPRCPLRSDDCGHAENSRCTEGCLDPKAAQLNGVQLFDGTAPKAVQNQSVDFVTNLGEILSSMAPRYKNVDYLPRDNQGRRPMNSFSYSSESRRTSVLAKRHYSCVGTSNHAGEMQSLMFLGSDPTVPETDAASDSSVLPINSDTSLSPPTHQPQSLVESALSPKSSRCRFTLAPDENEVNHELFDESPYQQKCSGVSAISEGLLESPRISPFPASLHFRYKACSCDYRSHVEQPSRRASRQKRSCSIPAISTWYNSPETDTVLMSSRSNRVSFDLQQCKTLEKFTNIPPKPSSSSREPQSNVDESDWIRGPHGLRVLTLDGGGVRGLIHVQTLRALERATKRNILDIFDWLVGTSCGGVIALLLLRGKCLRCCRSMLFSFKENVFNGKRPYCADGLEKILRKELGENTVMTDLKMNRVAVTTLVCDRCPPILHLFRNYPSPRSILQELTRNEFQQVNAGSGTISLQQTGEDPVRKTATELNDSISDSAVSNRASSSSVLGLLRTASGFFTGGDAVVGQLPPTETGASPTFEPIETDSEQLVWKAARATGAAPTFFRPCGRFIDGGLIANNPTLDFLTEYQEMCVTWRLQNEPVVPLAVVVSLGTGRQPVEPIESVDVFRPQTFTETMRSLSGFGSLSRVIIEAATMSNGPAVDRASAWCASLGVPCYRFCPQLSSAITLDTYDTKILLQMVWETEAYLYRSKQRIEELAAFLVEEIHLDVDSPSE